MNDERKAIFSEGVTVTQKPGGLYTVTDTATGLPISGVRGIELRAERGGLFSPGRIVAVLDIDTSTVKCTLQFENDETE